MKQKKKMKYFKVFSISVIGILATILLMFFCFFNKQEIKVDSIYVKNIDVTNKLLTFNGGHSSSALKYSGYNYEIKNRKIYITLFRSYIYFSKPHETNEIKYNKDGLAITQDWQRDNINFEIKGDFKNIKKVYIQDSDNVKVIWSN